LLPRLTLINRFIKSSKRWPFSITLTKILVKKKKLKPNFRK
jgi:hypothetical protein